MASWLTGSTVFSKFRCQHTLSQKGKSTSDRVSFEPLLAHYPTGTMAHWLDSPLGHPSFRSFVVKKLSQTGKSISSHVTVMFTLANRSRTITSVKFRCEGGLSQIGSRSPLVSFRRQSSFFQIGNQGSLTSQAHMDRQKVESQKRKWHKWESKGEIEKQPLFPSSSCRIHARPSPSQEAPRDGKAASTYDTQRAFPQPRHKGRRNS